LSSCPTRNWLKTGNLRKVATSHSEITPPAEIGICADANIITIRSATTRLVKILQENSIENQESGSIESR